MVVITRALYSAPVCTVTFGNVATYSIMPPPALGLVAVAVVEQVRLEADTTSIVPANRYPILCLGIYP